MKKGQQAKAVLIYFGLCVSHSTRHLIISFIPANSYLWNWAWDWLSDLMCELRFIEPLLCVRHFSMNYSYDTSYLITPCKGHITSPFCVGMIQISGDVAILCPRGSIRTRKGQIWTQECLTLKLMGSIVLAPWGWAFFFLIHLLLFPAVSSAHSWDAWHVAGTQ